jgi:phosphatidylserine/phosphatidylglycerophosphate/cardiolipin synthase-like enzyme
LPVLLAPPHAVGGVALRVVATVPRSTGNFRLDLMIAALARKSLWITDAYFMATAPYVQALSATARDGGDVRLLVPGTSDVPFVGASRRNRQSALAWPVAVVAAWLAITLFGRYLAIHSSEARPSRR